MSDKSIADRIKDIIVEQLGVNADQINPGAKFIEALELFSHLANVGDAKSLVIHPASTTHQQMSAADLEDAGVGEEMVRLAVGLEDAGDIVADLKQALRASQK